MGILLEYCMSSYLEACIGLRLDWDCPSDHKNRVGVTAEVARERLFNGCIVVEHRPTILLLFSDDCDVSG